MEPRKPDELPRCNVSQNVMRQAAIARDYFANKKEADFYEFQENQRKKNHLETLLANPAYSQKEKDSFVEKYRQSENYLLRQSRLPMNINDYEILKVIGRGAFGEVRLVRYKRTGELFAMKSMLKRYLEKREQQKSIRSERDVLTIVRHPHIVDLLYTFQDSDHLYMIMEFCSGGDLMGLLIKKDCLSEEAAKFYTAEMILAISSLHDGGYIHRDLKPDNFLITNTGHIKLTDMGMCTRLREEVVGENSNANESVETNSSTGMGDGSSSTCSNDSMESERRLNESENDPKVLAERKQTRRLMAFSQVGTPDYVSPEVILKQGYRFEADWWSLGVMVYEMLAGFTPFYDRKQERVYQKICAWRTTLRFPRDMLEKCSTQCIDFIRRLLMDSPNRLGIHGIQELKQHPWFAGTNWELLHQMEAPFKPGYFRDLGIVQELLRHTPITDPVFQELVSELCQNFDEFEDAPLYSSRVNSPKAPYYIGYTFKRERGRPFGNNSFFQDLN